MTFAYVGSRTSSARNARGKGISVYKLDAHRGALTLVQVLGDLVNPSFLALNKKGDRLYAVHGDEQEASVFSVNRADGRLKFMQKQHCGGKNPVHLALDPSEQFLVVSNHLSSNLAVLPVLANGELAAVSQTVTLTGIPGPHRVEQPFAKPHFNPFDPTGQYVVVPDKGLDKIFSFLFADGQLNPAASPSVTARETAGPRHIAFHPDRPIAFAVNELDSTVTRYQFDVATGELKPLQILSTLPDTFTGNSRASEIVVTPNGSKLYASNRGDDSIAVYDIDGETGRLTFLATTPSGGRTPRFFTLSPDGRWMFVLNEDSDSIVTFAVQAQTGGLVPMGGPVACGSPVCMVFSPEDNPPKVLIGYR